jgi:hypothetical protein
MAKALDIVDSVVETSMWDFWRKSGAQAPVPPPQSPMVDTGGETDFYTRNPFQAWEHALATGRHNPKLWAVIKGSVYEPLYRAKFLGGHPE